MLMKFKIFEIGLYNSDKVDTVKFKDGVNIISGTSKTGKSSIGKILNYCLGSSKNIIPEGIVRKNTETYAILLMIDKNIVLIARNRYDAEHLGGEKYLYIESINNVFSLDNLSQNYFIKNDSNFVRLKDFLEIEIVKYFPSYPPKTRKGGNEYVRPSIRHMPPFIFQNQNIISNESTLFFGMDTPIKQSGIIRDFELFLGIVSNDVYNTINRKNELLKLIKKLHNKQELYTEELENEEKKLRGHYDRLYSHLNVNIDVDTTELSELKDIDTLNKIQIEYKIDGDVNKKYQKLKEQCNIQSRTLEKLKIEYANIENQINNINKTSLSLNTLIDHTESKHSCPLCNAKTDEVFAPFIEAKKKIISEQRFLNNYNQDILQDKFEEKSKEIISITTSLNIFLEQLEEMQKDFVAIKSMEESIALQHEIKGIIKASIKNIQKYEESNNQINDLEKYEKELKKLDKTLAKINLKRQRQIAENKISEYATTVLKELPFETEEYGEANLKFDIKDISFYQQQNDSILYMTEMGSAENYLACHLAIILGLHRYIQTNKDSILPSLIFLDQPSQVYFPEAKDFSGKQKKGDMLIVENIYKTIIKFIDKWNENEDTKIQLIIVDHFYDNEGWYEDRLLEPRWSKENKRGLVKKLINL